MNPLFEKSFNSTIHSLILKQISPLLFKFDLFIKIKNSKILLIWNV